MLSHLKYIVTGTPRSATKYMAKLIESAGLRCGHEYEFHHDRDWSQSMEIGYPAESAWQAGCRLHEIAIKWPSIRIIHIVRDPLHTISSQINSNYPYGYFGKPEMRSAYMYMMRHVPGIQDTSLTNLDKYLWFYLYWNTLIGRYAHVRMQAEKMANNPEFYLRYVGIPVKDRHALLTDTKKNTYGLAPEKYLTMDQLLDSKFYAAFAALRKSYGYN